MTVDFPILMTLAGSLSLEVLGGTSLVDLPLLESLGGSLIVSTPTVGPSTFEVPLLAEVAGSFDVRVGSSAWADLSKFEAIESVDILWIEGFQFLTTLGLTNLVEVTSRLDILNNPLLSCAEIEGLIVQLTTMPAPAFINVTGNQTVCNTP